MLLNTIMFTGITLDGASSRDLDDAVWAVKSGDGIQIQVFISDVAKRIEKGSDLDRSAKNRIESKYLPERVDHMLPPALSEGTLSLLPNQIRDAIAVQFELDNAGVIQNFKFEIGTFMSLAQLSYHEADSALEDSNHPFHSLLELLQTAATRLSQRRRKSGAVYGQEIKGLWIDEEGKAVSKPFHKGSYG